MKISDWTSSGGVLVCVADPDPNYHFGADQGADQDADPDPDF
jgi:hypothetical protein